MLQPVNLYINVDDKDENENIFDELFKLREQIDKDFGEGLDWERKDNYIYCKIEFKEDGNFPDKGEWDSMIELMTDKMVKLENAFNGPIAELKKEVS